MAAHWDPSAGDPTTVLDEFVCGLTGDNCDRVGDRLVHPLDASAIVEAFARTGGIEIRPVGESRPDCPGFAAPDAEWVGRSAQFEAPEVVADSARIVVWTQCVQQRPNGRRSLSTRADEFVFRRGPDGDWDLVLRRLYGIS
ncbi:MAG: hypothetical protein OEN00_08480 [Gemmatimonadota bacterium]|nr:hypothetical protein [Gemmatimonadota bacterium]